jgi:class 3 adenylate cyclase
VGHAANLAARMQSVAPAGGIVISGKHAVWSRATSNCVGLARPKAKASVSQSTSMRWSGRVRCAAISNWQRGAG